MVHLCWCSRYIQCLCLHLSPECKTHAGSMNLSYNYRQIMGMCVCDVDNYDCMMGHCDDCLDASVLKSFLQNKLLRAIYPDDTVQFIQWVSTDRSQLVKEESKFEDFIEILVGKFGKLTEWNFGFSFLSFKLKSYNEENIICNTLERS